MLIPGDLMNLPPFEIFLLELIDKIERHLEQKPAANRALKQVYALIKHLAAVRNISDKHGYFASWNHQV